MNFLQQWKKDDFLIILRTSMSKILPFWYSPRMQKVKVPMYYEKTFEIFITIGTKTIITIIVSKWNE